MDEHDVPGGGLNNPALPAESARTRVLSRGAAYTLSIAGPKSLQLVTLPLFTLVMSAAEFGRMAVAVAVSLAIIPLLTRSLETAVFRSWYVLEGDEDERRRYLSTAAIAVLVLTNALALVVVLLAMPYTADSNKLPTSYLALALFGSAMLISATVVPLGVLRAQDRLNAFLRVSLVGPAITIPLTVVAVVWLELGARGWLAANLIGALATIPVALSALREQWTTQLSRAHLRSLAVWAVPFVPHGIAHWTLATSDRVILASYVSLADLGVYNVGYQLALALALLYTALNNVISSNYGRAISDAVQRARLPQIITYQLLATAGLGLAVALLAPPAIDALLPTQFDAAQKVVPWIALGYVFFGLYLVPMNTIVILAGDTKFVWVPTSLAAASNVVLNLAFVPSGGIFAASVSTAASYLVMLIVMSLYSWRRFPVPGGVEWRMLVFTAVWLAAAYGVAVARSPTDPLLAFCWRLACVAVCATVIFWYDRRARARPMAPRAPHS